MFKNLFKKKINLKDIHFDMENYSYQGSDNGINVWESNQGDGLGIYFFAKRPDLPEGKLDEQLLKTFYGKQLDPINGKVVELTKESLSDIEVIKLIIKVPQDPSGMTYIVSYTLPFQDFSFVIKAQCMEIGMTGIKETILLQRHMEQGGELEGIDVDNEEFDEEFPEHPVARARKISEDIIQGLTISEKIKQSKHYYQS